MTHTERTHSSAFGDTSNVTERISEHENQELQTFQYTEHSVQHIEHDTDPDNNFFNSVNNNCCYYTEEQYGHVNKDGQFSIIHINGRRHTSRST